MLNRHSSNEEAWQHHANCLESDPELFFPQRNENDLKSLAVLEAIRICSQCDVRDTCRQVALDSKHQYGIWGGTTPNQRTAISRKEQREKKLAQKSISGV
jgi:WhiB family redox-sensing transcriptional regulator